MPAAPATNASANERARSARIRIFTSHLDWNFVHVGGRVAGAFVDAHDGLTRGPRHEAEDLARLGIQPRPLVVDALLALDREIATMGLGELLLAYPEEPGVDVHEL